MGYTRQLRNFAIRTINPIWIAEKREEYLEPTWVERPFCNIRSGWLSWLLPFYPHK